MAKITLNIVGQTYGRLLIKEEVDPYIYPKGFKARRYKCQCKCGNETIVEQGSLRTGKTTSCGCLARETAKRVHTKHGMNKSLEYSSWENIKQRCFNKKNDSYYNYGGPG